MTENGFIFCLLFGFLNYIG